MIWSSGPPHVGEEHVIGQVLAPGLDDPEDQNCTGKCMACTMMSSRPFTQSRTSPRVGARPARAVDYLRHGHRVAVSRDKERTGAHGVGLLVGGRLVGVVP